MLITGSFSAIVCHFVRWDKYRRWWHSNRYNFILCHLPLISCFVIRFTSRAFSWIASLRSNWLRYWLLFCRHRSLIVFHLLFLYLLSLNEFLLEGNLLHDVTRLVLILATIFLFFLNALGRRLWRWVISRSIAYCGFEFLLLFILKRYDGVSLVV